LFSGHSAARQNVDSPDIFRFDDKIVDFQNLQLRVGGNIVQLTVTEVGLLRYWVGNAGDPMSRSYFA
jgi:DNA-binding response OmpR family regulator